MIDPRHKTAKESHQPRPIRAPHRTPRLEVLGSLRTATRGSGGMGADGALGMTRMSDRRVKVDILKVGQHPLGLSIYWFRYRPPACRVRTVQAAGSG